MLTNSWKFNHLLNSLEIKFKTLTQYCWTNIIVKEVLKVKEIPRYFSEKFFVLYLIVFCTLYIPFQMLSFLKEIFSCSIHKYTKWTVLNFKKNIVNLPSMISAKQLKKYFWALVESEKVILHARKLLIYTNIIKS